jgi:uncharacterized protein
VRIGLLADTHDRLPAIESLVNAFAEAGAQMVLHAGDYCSPFALKPLMAAGLPVLGVFGRNDGDHEGLRAAAAHGMGVELYDSPHSIDVSGQRIMLVHDIGEVNKRSVASHVIVVSGCSHEYSVAQRGDALLINPGEACGWLHGACMGAVLDLETRTVEQIRV